MNMNKARSYKFCESYVFTGKSIVQIFVQVMANLIILGYLAVVVLKYEKMLKYQMAIKYCHPACRASMLTYHMRNTYKMSCKQTLFWMVLVESI